MVENQFARAQCDDRYRRGMYTFIWRQSQHPLLTTFDAADRPVEFSRVIYRADRFRFTIESFHRQDRVFHLIGAG